MDDKEIETDESDDASSKSDWKEDIQSIKDIKLVDYICSIAQAQRQVLQAEKDHSKPDKKYNFPVEKENPDEN